MEWRNAALWGTFSALIVACLAVDLKVGQNRHGRMPVRTAAVWSAIWIALSLCFAGVVWIYPPEGANGRQLATLYVTGYLVEKALSVDNMFVFIMIFAYFKVRDEDQPRVLKWGIIGALLFRGALITLGSLLLRFEVVLYIFALFLLWAAWKMLRSEDEEIEPEKNPVLNFVKRFFPIVNRYEGHHFLIRENGRLVGTALLVVLVVIESTDIVFATDSIPAIFALTQPEVKLGTLSPANEFFVVFTSNIFAILGLRALFFVLAGVMDMFHYLKTGVAVILFFIAAKMLSHHYVPISPAQSLAVIGAILTGSVLASILLKPPAKAEAEGGSDGAAATKADEAPAARP